ncbi:hypothetical protein GW17_00010139 [Ensete ventricosum]|nr:hypothetical protein GW17_00010139 [Ensete ventricosum]
MYLPQELSSDSSQHVRSALASVIMGMAPVLGKVFSIREAAANNLKRLAEEFGPEWAMHNIVPQLMEKISNPHYLHRMTILQSISLLAPVLGSESTYQKLLPVIITASKDR